MKKSIVREPVLIAIRRYAVEGRGGATYEAIDRMWRLPGGRFELEETGGTPDDMLQRIGYSRSDVFAWYQLCPEQVERVSVL